MMKKELREKILAYNRKRAEEGAKANDMDVVIRCMGKLPPGQLKKLLDDEELVVVLKKYGLEI